jgi:hypothetical protein
MKKTIYSLLLSIAYVTQAPMTFATEETKKPTPCLSTREFITNLEFLREHKELGLGEADARTVSHKVSEGCTGASRRFIQVTNVLVKAGVPSRRSLETAQKFSLHTDEMTNAFLTVFKGAFIEDLLDLDVNNALTIALEIASSYEGKSSMAEKNFNQLVGFCLDRKSLDLPLLECARMGSRVIKNGSPFGFDITTEFISLFNYLTDPKKANIVTFEALSVSEFVTKFGPESKRNFIQGFEYALSKKGLDVGVKEAIEFGKSMASRSTKI